MHLHEVAFALLAALLGELCHGVFTGHGSQLRQGLLPEGVEVLMAVGERHHVGGLVADVELLDNVAGILYEAGVEARCLHGELDADSIGLSGEEVKRLCQAKDIARLVSIGGETECQLGTVGIAQRVVDDDVDSGRLGGVPPQVMAGGHFYLEVVRRHGACHCGETAHDEDSLFHELCCYFIFLIIAAVVAI